MYHPKIYEINTRVWLRKFNAKENRATLTDVPMNYWEDLAAKGFDYVWLMGVWKNCESSIQKYCMGPSSRNQYKAALNDWSDEDVIGSPFAINDYELNPLVGKREDIINLKHTLNKLNIKLILDFIPNHFSAESDLIKSNPELFLQVDREKFESDKVTYFKDPFGRDIYFAHGKDPYFPAWSDTVQVNYFSDVTREFMNNSLVNVSEICDGVRCDMAMLMLNDIFNNTWGSVWHGDKLDNNGIEFWKSAIQKVKNSNQDFVLIAEAYWDLEWRLQQLGFDYTYDKKLTDLLVNGNAKLIREHLKADADYQNKSVRFIENHDEDRAAASLGIAKSKAASVIAGTLPGMRFFHDGQFEGKKIRLPVQLARETVEPVIDELAEHYKILMHVTQKDILKTGTWKLISPIASGDGDFTFENIVVWQWVKDNKTLLCVINYSNTTSYCKIEFTVEGSDDEIVLFDIINQVEFVRRREEINKEGLFIKLAGFASHIFEY